MILLRLLRISLFTILVFLSGCHTGKPVNHAAGGDAVLVGGGGGYQTQIAMARYGAILALQMIEAGYDLQALYQPAYPTDSDRLNFSVPFLLANAKQIEDAIRKLDVRVTNEGLSIPSPDGTLLPVEAKLVMESDAPNGRVYLSVGSLDKAIALLVHEACHSFETTLGTIGDFDPFGPYTEQNGGQALLNDVGKYAQLFFEGHLPRPGAIDPSFGKSGYAYLDADIRRPMVKDIVLQSDGHVVVAGYFSNQPMQCFVSRLNSDGSLDTGFGTNGFFLTSFPYPGGYAKCFRVVAQSDDSLLVSGFWWGQSDPASPVTAHPKLFRLTPQGSVDSSWGNSSGVIDVEQFTGQFDLAVLPNGKILAAGIVLVDNKPFLAVRRYLASGAVDESFGNQGTATADPYGDLISNTVKIAMGSDGTMVVWGTTTLNLGEGKTAFQNILARFSAEGLLDTSFGQLSIGIVRLGPSGTVSAVQKDGKILLAWPAQTASGWGFSVSRLNADGSFDRGFGNSGGIMIERQSSTFAIVGTIALQADGKIVVSGDSSLRLMVARLLPSGVLDTTFNPKGDHPGQTDFICAKGYTNLGKMVIAPDGRMLVLGNTTIDKPMVNGKPVSPWDITDPRNLCVARLYGDRDPFYESLGF